MTKPPAQNDRRNLPLLLRTHIVLREEGIAGIVRRLFIKVRHMYARLFPAQIDHLYDTNFLSSRVEKNRYLPALASWIAKTIQPDSVLDVGCGDAALLTLLSQYHIPAYGLEGSTAAVKVAPSDVCVFQADLNRSFLLNKQFDLVCCIEVAEHLSRRSATTLIAGISSHARKMIIFSAAHPNQGGLGHINEQPAEYWRKIFMLNNWTEDTVLSDQAKGVLRSAEAPWYLPQNIMVFVKVS